MNINKVEQTKPPVAPTEPPVAPTEPPADPTDPPAGQTQPPANPTEPPAAPNEPPVAPTEPPADPTEPPAGQTQPPADPTQPPADPTEPPAAQNKPPADPTEPPDLTEPPVDPTEPPADSTESPSDSTKPSADPTEPKADLTEPPADLTEPQPTETGCLTGDGASYSGTVSVTETGQTCQHWDSQTPHAHDFTPANYPSSGLQQNYCRNPDGEPGGVWCYTTDPGERWDYCDAPACPDCQTGDGASYSGTASITETGQTCQHWESQTPHGHDYTPANYPSSGLLQNYCRNPDGEPGVWCYTTDPGERWGFCDVPACPGTPTSASGCGGTLTALEGTVTSPNHPSDYGNNENCEWTIAAPEGSTVRLTFDSFNLEDSYDFLTIYDGDSDSALQLGRFTGSDIPVPSPSTSNIMLVRFTSDGSATAQGFRFSFTGTVTSPNYPSDYGNNEYCEWTIAAPEGSTVRLMFDSLNLENGYDFLTIYDGDSDSALQLGRFSGSDIPVPSPSTSNMMLVRFTSDGSTTAQGFRFSFTGTLTAIEGSVTSPNYPSDYNNNANSEWTITVPEGSTVRLTFDSFNLENGFDFLTIYDGGSDSALQLGRFTGDGSDIPDHIRGTSIIMFVRFTSDGSTTALGFRFSFTDDTAPDVTTTALPIDVISGTGCLTGDGASYSGTVSVTETGQTCQHWNSQTPHAHDFTPANYPSSGLLQNYCRNPDGEPGVWCYTTDPSERWGFCDLPACPVPTGTPTSASACGGTLTASEGTVTSPNYPSDYGNNEYCEWTIAAPEGSTVRLTFDSFNLENGWDFLNIYDGDSDTASLIWSLTGDMSVIPGHIISTSNMMLVRFTSDESTTAQGFEFSFTDGGCWDDEFRCSEGSCLPTAWRCDGTPHCLSGEDEEDCGDDGGGCSPGDAVCDDGSSCYPVEGVCDSVVDCSDGSDEANFCLLFTGPPCSGTQLKCLDGTCIDKSTDVCDGENDCMDGVDEQQCWIPEDVTPTGSSECGGSLTASDEGTVTSPNYPSDYGNNENCEWTITAPEGSTVRLTFDSFNLENGWDFLNIYDGDSDTASLIWSLSGDMSVIPGPITSTSNMILVRFTSDGSTTAQGFQFSFTDATAPDVTTAAIPLDFTPWTFEQV
ncbi:deleted in malignant brain tumors 1 protein-like [Branchiostoma lanceolatum]|uniref:deleted in malignant brain tumors 1 protein-like n=1 Tax=Branchiostoma lanceolatum TaxID=7740 RepID=UPI00345249D6